MSKKYREKKNSFRQRNLSSKTTTTTTRDESKEIEAFFKDIYDQISNCSYSVNLKLKNHYFEMRCSATRSKIEKLAYLYTSTFAKAVTASKNAEKILLELKGLYQSFQEKGTL